MYLYIIRDRRGVVVVIRSGSGSGGSGGRGVVDSRGWCSRVAVLAVGARARLVSPREMAPLVGRAPPPAVIRTTPRPAAFRHGTHSPTSRFLKSVGRLHARTRFDAHVRGDDGISTGPHAERQDRRHAGRPGPCRARQERPTATSRERDRRLRRRSVHDARTPERNDAAGARLLGDGSPWSGARLRSTVLAKSLPA